QSLPPPAARLVIRSGIVEVHRGNAWLPIATGEWLNPGEYIRTGSGSSAVFDLGLGKVVTLNESSELQIGQSSASPAVQLERGSMKVFSESDIQLAAKDVTLQTAEHPLDVELGFQADRLNLMVFSGAVQNGPVIIHGGNPDAGLRTHTAGGRS